MYYTIRVNVGFNMTTTYEQITTEKNGTWPVKDHLLHALHI